MSLRNVGGDIFRRKKRGRIMQWMLGGPTRDEAHKFINWSRAAGFEFFHKGDDGITVRLTPAGYEEVGDPHFIGPRKTVKNPPKKSGRVKKWTAAMRKAFAEKMRKARALAGRTAGKKKRVRRSRSNSILTAHREMGLTPRRRRRNVRRRVLDVYDRPARKDGVVIVVHVPKRPHYYAKDNILTSSRAAAHVFKSTTEAGPVARRIAGIVEWRVSLNKP